MSAGSVILQLVRAVIVLAAVLTAFAMALDATTHLVRSFDREVLEPSMPRSVALVEYVLALIALMLGFLALRYLKPRRLG